jgi:flagellar secretion chaperone FliS
MLNPYRNQMDQDILCAEPLELVVMLYKGLLGNIRDARQQLKAGDIAGRALSVSLAMAIVGELASTLDLDRGGELAAGLHQLYAYLATRLLDGNYRQVDGPLAEAEEVTATLLEAWTTMRAGIAAAVPVAVPIPAYGDHGGYGTYGNEVHGAEPAMASSYGQHYG